MGGGEYLPCDRPVGLAHFTQRSDYPALINGSALHIAFPLKHDWVEDPVLSGASENVSAQIQGLINVLEQVFSVIDLLILGGR